MTQLCKISAEIGRAKTKARAEANASGKDKIRKRQIADPRIPYEVLAQEGISPYLGSRKRSDTRQCLWKSTVKLVLTTRP